AHQEGVVLGRDVAVVAHEVERGAVVEQQHGERPVRRGLGHAEHAGDLPGRRPDVAAVDQGVVELDGHRSPPEVEWSAAGRRNATTRAAPTTSATAAPPVAVAKPCTRAAVGVPTKSRVALTATVFSTAVPTLLPICMAVLAAAAAMPASLGSTPLVATPID